MKATFALHLTELQVLPLAFEGRNYGILWVDVQETDYLCQLHECVNTLATRRPAMMAARTSFT